MQALFKFFSIVILSATCFYSHAQEKLPVEGDMPILAWIGVPERETTLARYQEMKAAGININFANFSSIEAAEKALDIAKQAGIKLQPYCPELKSDPEKTVRRLMKHPALAGYHLRDEPNATDFPELAEWVKRIQTVDKQHYCYINLFPNYASKEQLFGDDYKSQPGRDVYAAHVDTFLKHVSVPFISFDHYPVIEKNEKKVLRPEWYKNLEIIAAASKKFNLPFWAFSLSVAHGPYPIPTIADIRLQMYSNLAYGAQVLQYFTYWNPGVNASWDFHDAPIGLDGKRTVVYDRMKEVNREIQNLSGVFLHSKLVSVAHTGKEIPPGTRRLAKLPDPVKVLETGDNGAVVAVLEKGDRQFLVIVNRDTETKMKLTIVTDDRVKRVLKDGTLVPVNAYTPSIEVDPGDVVVYAWARMK